MAWTKEDEDFLIERNIKSFNALAAQHQESLGPQTLHHIAFSMALATLHARELLKALGTRAIPCSRSRDLGSRTPSAREASAGSTAGAGEVSLDIS